MAKRQRRRRQERRQEHSKRRGWQTRHSVITGVGLAAGAALGMSSGAQAAAYNYYVGSTADTSTATDCDDPANTDCTLRDAIYAANDNSGYADTIYFNSSISGTPIVLGSDLPIIDDPVYIVGNGPNADTISGDDSYRIFNIDVTNSGDSVSISSLKLVDGYGDNGGAIRDEDAVLSVYNTQVSGSTAAKYGGGIYVKGNDPYNGTNTQITYSTISDNYAGNGGGGLYGFESIGTIGTSTISGNSASGIGGGASTYTPSFTYSSTFSGNSSQYAGGFADLNGYGYIYNSIFANNTAPGQDPDLGHDFYAGFDLIRTPDSATLAPGIFNAGPNIIGQDPQLGPLQVNAPGVTPTLKPAAGSPVVDQGLSFINDDQRGISRPIDNPNKPNAPGGDGGDMGSVELTLAEGPQAPTPTTTPTPPFNLKKAIKKCKKKFPGKKNAKRRKKCIKKAKRRARVASSPWRHASHRWARNAPGPVGHHAFRDYRR
jgi:hypothetical protein